MQKYYVIVDAGNSYTSGTRWYSDPACTILSRVGGPAVECLDGYKFWCKEGINHRTDGPAVINPNGTKQWYVDGNLHRTDGPAIEYGDGSKEWFIDGNLHRTDGPAIEYGDGSKEWFIDGNLHRTDGPAVEPSDGARREWWLNGKKVSKKEHARLTAPVQEMTVAQIEAVLGKRIKVVK